MTGLISVKSLPSWVPVVALVGAVGAAWLDLQVRVSEMGVLSAERAATVARDVETLGRRLEASQLTATAQDTRIRTVEAMMGRLEERLSNISEGVARIEQRLSPSP